MLEGPLDFLASADAVLRALQRLPGMRASAAQYVVLRAMGEPDAFPLTESLLQRLWGTTRLPALDAIEERTQCCRPWRGYAALHLCGKAAAHRQSAPSRWKHTYGASGGR